MIIKSMKASFGCLNNAQLQLHEGLNVISAPNESGKSTWCAFIRCMLYGIDSAQREKLGVKPDKVKYAPWSGAAMAGEMEIEFEGKSITLSRSGKSAAAPFRDFTAQYSGTGQKVSGLSGKDAGEVLTGLPKAVFESSVFVRQSGMAVQNGPELEKRINAIISSGEDEGISYTDADATLRAWLRKRRHNNSGAIPAAQSRLDQLQRSLDASGDRARSLEQLDGDIAHAKARLEQLQQLQQDRKQQQTRSTLQELDGARSRCEESALACAQAQSARDALRSEIDKSIFEGKSPDEAESVLGPELEEYSRRDNIRINRWLVFLLLFAGLGVLLAAGSLAGWMYIPGGVLLAAAVVCAILWRYRDNHYIGWGKMLEGKYGFADRNQLAGLMELYRSKWRSLEAAEARLAQAQQAKAQADAALTKARNSLINPQTDDDSALSYARSRLESLQHRRAEVCGALEATGDPMVLKSEKYDLEQELAELRSQYEALSLAIETLSQANEEMQQRFSPRLGQRAGEIMQALTGGKYQRLSFDRSLAAEAGREEDTVTHSAAFLSEGTADQLYLALRLAICELALPEDRSCPLILDDALVNFDEERMGYALELLREIAKTRQVILFSCHDREARYLSANEKH